MKKTRILLILIAVINIIGCASEKSEINDSAQKTDFNYKYYHNGNLLKDKEVIEKLLSKAEATEFDGFNGIANIYLTKEEVNNFENSINFNKNNTEKSIASDLNSYIIVYDGRVSWNGQIQDFSSFVTGPFLNYYSQRLTHLGNGQNIQAPIANLVTTPHGRIIHLINGSRTSGYVIFFSGTFQNGIRTFVRLNARSHVRVPNLGFQPLSHAVSAYQF